MKISVCVGSSCHLKGSYDVIEVLKETVEKYGLSDKVELKASFCLGHCADGVTAGTDGGIFLHRLNKDNVEEIFVRECLPLIEKEEG